MSAGCHVEICVAEDLGQGIIINAHAVPAGGHRVPAAVGVHTAGVGADPQPLQRGVVVPSAEISRIQVSRITG